MLGVLLLLHRLWSNDLPQQQTPSQPKSCVGSAAAPHHTQMGHRTPFLQLPSAGLLLLGRVRLCSQIKAGMRSCASLGAAAQSFEHQRCSGLWMCHLCVTRLGTGQGCPVMEHSRMFGFSMKSLMKMGCAFFQSPAFLGSENQLQSPTGEGTVSSSWAGGKIEGEELQARGRKRQNAPWEAATAVPRWPEQVAAAWGHLCV